MQKRKMKVPRGSLEASLDAQDSGEATIIMSAGSRGLRSNGFQSFYEELDVSDRALDLSAIRGGPLLDTHDSTSIDSIIGRVTSAWIEGGVAKAKVKFGSDERSQRAYQKVRDNLVTSASVGYQILGAEDATRDGEQFPTIRVASWKIRELSLVAVPFDEQAKILSVRNQDLQDEIEILINERSTMSKKVEATPEQIEFRRAELERCKKIREEVRTFGLPSETVFDKQSGETFRFKLATFARWKCSFNRSRYGV